jgi:uncharacterized protein
MLGNREKISVIVLRRMAKPGDATPNLSLSLNSINYFHQCNLRLKLFISFAGLSGDPTTLSCLALAGCFPSPTGTVGRRKSGSVKLNQGSQHFTLILLQKIINQHQNCITMVVLHPVTLGDKKLFDGYFKKVKGPIADTTFAMRFIWAGPLKHTWTIINGDLCVFGFLKDRYFVWGPPVGGEKLAETIQQCFEIVNSYNKKAGISANPGAIYIPESIKKEYEAVAEELGCSLEFWTQDYVYKTQDLIELKGSAYDSKRNKANYFEKNYEWKIEEFEPEKHAEACLKLIDIWKNEKDQVVPESARYELDSEAEVAKAVIKNAVPLGVSGIVLNVEGNVAGISLGEPLTTDMFSNIIEKTNPAINGASEFIFREFARHNSKFAFLNAQDDFGVDYLKRVKLSYHPARLMPSYFLEKK